MNNQNKLNVKKIVTSLSGTAHSDEFPLKISCCLNAAIKEVAADRREANQFTLYQICFVNDAISPIHILGYINDECLVSFSGRLFRKEIPQEVVNSLQKRNVDLRLSDECPNGVRIIKNEDSLLMYNCNVHTLFDGIIEKEDYNNWEQYVYWY